MVAHFRFKSVVCQHRHVAGLATDLRERRFNSLTRPTVLRSVRSDPKFRIRYTLVAIYILCHRLAVGLPCFVFLIHPVILLLM